MTHPTKGAATMVSDEAKQRACDLANAFNRDCWKFDAADVEQVPVLTALAQLCQDISDAVKQTTCAGQVREKLARFILHKPDPFWPFGRRVSTSTWHEGAWSERKVTGTIDTSDEANPKPDPLSLGDGRIRSTWPEPQIAGTVLTSEAQLQTPDETARKWAIEQAILGGARGEYNVINTAETLLAFVRGELPVKEGE